MAESNLKLGQCFSNSLLSIYNQFIVGGSTPQSIQLNQAYALSLLDFQTIMDQPTVPLAGGDLLTPNTDEWETFVGDPNVIGVDWLKLLDWKTFSAEDWFNLMGSPAFIATKASLFLRLAGLASPAFSVSDTFVIDVANFNTFSPGDYFVTLGSPLGFTGSGTASFQGTSDSPSSPFDIDGAPIVSFPLTLATDTPFKFSFRVSSDTGYPFFDVMIDGQVMAEFRTAAEGFNWVSCQLLLPDQAIHTLTLRARQVGLNIDKLVIDNTGLTFSGTETGPAYDDSPYVTAHVQVYNTDGNGTPTTPQQTYDSKTTAGEMLVDDWYNFNVSLQLNATPSSALECAIVVTVSGGNDGHFLMWDLSSTAGTEPSAVYDGTTWTTGTAQNYSLMVYSDNPNSTMCAATGRPAQLFDISINNFDSEQATFLNTRLSGSSDNPSGQIVLDDPDKIISIVLDESGSNTWNDPNGIRYQLAQDIVTRIDQHYAGDVTYNLIVFGGSVVFPVLFATTQQFNDGTPAEIATSFFLNNSTTAIAGVRIVRKIGSYSQNPNDGVKLQDGIFTRFRDTGLTPNLQYFYSIYTYSQQYQRFSAPVQITVVPTTKVIPVGISNFSATTATGTGVQVDSNVLGAWHLDEGSGLYAFDFSDSSLMLTGMTDASPDAPYWLDQSAVPIGRSGVRLNGQTEYLQSASVISGAPNGDLTLMAWVYWYSGTGTIVSREATDLTSMSYRLCISSSGALTVGLTLSTVFTSTATITPEEWTHVAITYSEESGTIEVFVNGTLMQTASSHTIIADNSLPMVTTIGNRADGSVPLFGRVTEVSSHCIVRDSGYIAAAAIPNSTSIQDNGDRIVIFNWLMGEASAGTIIIVENANSSPANYSDGNVVYEQMLEAGSYAASRSDRFRIESTRYYRIFVLNEYNNYSQFEDSAAVTIIIPSLSIADPTPLSPPLAPCASFVATPINGAVILNWVMPTDYRATGVYIFWDTAAIPVVESLGVFSGQYLVDLDASQSQYVFTAPSNDTLYYFSIVAVTNLNQISVILDTSATPLSTSPVVVLIPPSVSGLRSESLSDTTVELAWDNPIDFIQSAQGYVGDNIYLYSMLMDEYGNVVTGVPDLTIAYKTDITTDKVPDVFADASGTITSDSYSVTTANQNNGLLCSTVTFENNDASVNLLSQAVFTLNIITSYMADNGNTSYTYKSLPTTITYYNPLVVTITNLYGMMVSDETRNSLGQLGSTTTDGAYAGCSTPVTLRVSATWKGVPVGALLLNTIINTIPDIGSSQLEPEQTVSSGGSYVDVPVACPQYSMTMEFYANTSVSGFSRTNLMTLRFANPLKIFLSLHAPRNDGSNSAEQFATTYLIDPNEPSISSQLPNFTVVGWTINDPTQPFYSLDDTQQPGGVYSYIRNGTAKDVYFGPPTNVGPFGSSYVISAKVVYDGLVATDSAVLSIPNTPTPASPFVGGVFLSEFPTYPVPLWADGIDYARLTIVHNALESSTDLSSCFVTCAALNGRTIFVLPIGQQIQITTGSNYQIYWGNVVEYDSTADKYLDVTNAQTASGSATIPLSDGNVTYVYFRINTTGLSTTILPQPNNACECLPNYADNILTSDASPVQLVTSLFEDGNIVPLISGGAMYAGFPPTVLQPQEPLLFRVVDLRVDGVPSDVFVVDGVSENEIVFQVGWKNGPVPDGTVVSFSQSTSNSSDISLQFAANTAITTTQLDPYLNPSGPVASFCSVNVLPLSPVSPFTASFTASTSYDESGTVTRTQECLVRISFTGSYVPDRSTQVISGSFYKFTVLGSTWTTLPGLSYNRGALSLNYANGSFFAIGGCNGRSISQVNEKFAGTGWETVASMPTPRAYSQTVVVGDNVLVIGGIGADGLTEELTITAACEQYNSVSNTWTGLAAMPFGVAMGNAVYYNGNVFVFSGITALANNSDVAAFSDRVLVYNFAGNSWSYSNVLPDDILPLYQRVGAFAALKGTEFHVASGASGLLSNVYVAVGTAPSAAVAYQTIPYVSSVAGTAQEAADSLAVDDVTYRDVPPQRFKGGSIVLGSNVYFLGGSQPSFATSNVVNAYDDGSTYWSTLAVGDMYEGLHSFGATTDGTNLFVVGGMCTGRDASFLQLNLSASNSQMRLDGRQSLTLGVDVRDRNNNVPSGVDLLFTGTVGSEYLPTPVLFTNRDLVTNGQLEVNTLLPRSDDLLLPNGTLFQQVVKGSGAPSSRYDIFVAAVVQDTYYEGSTNDDSTVDALLNSGGIQIGNNVTLLGSTVKDTSEEGVFFQNLQTNSLFQFLPPAMDVGSGITIEAYSDIDWVPSINVVIGNNSGTAEQVIEEISQLSYDEAFGASSLLDATERAVTQLEEQNAFGWTQLIYAISDGDTLLNVTSESDLIADIQSLAGTTPVPFIGIDLALQQPLIDTASIDVSSDPLMEIIASQTGGQTLAVLGTDSLEETVNAACGRVTGSVGYGLVEYVVNLYETSILNELSLSFDLTPNSQASWMYSLSDDGFSYGIWSESLSANDVAYFTDQTCRFIKLSVSLASGLSVSPNDSDLLTADFPLMDLGEFVGLDVNDYVVGAMEEGSPVPTQSPALVGINIVFTKTTTDYVFLNPLPLSGVPDDVVLAVNADYPDNADILVGASTYDNYNWDRFNSSSSPAEDRNGKLVIPYRVFSDTGSSAKEALISLDGFIFTATYGRWQPNATTSVFSSIGEQVAADQYNVFPDDGIVVFSQPQSGVFYLSVVDQSILKVAIQITSQEITDPINIWGAGAMYTQK